MFLTLVYSFHNEYEAADISLKCYDGLRQQIILFLIFRLTKSALLDISMHKETTETLEVNKSK